MPVTEKDLAEDAPWKKIQQNTFTRWCNEHLKCVNKRIGNLQTDLSDGLRLIALLEVLSQKHMYRKYHQRPTFRQMQLENVSVALEFLDRESIKLVSIGECPGPAGTPRPPASTARAPLWRLKLPVGCPTTTTAPSSRGLRAGSGAGSPEARHRPALSVHRVAGGTAMKKGQRQSSARTWARGATTACAGACASGCGARWR